MKMGILVAATLWAIPAGALQEGKTSNGCLANDVAMGAYRAEPAKPEQSPDATLLPKAQSKGASPAVLVPNCKRDEPKRRKRDNHFLA